MSSLRGRSSKSKDEEDVGSNQLNKRKTDRRQLIPLREMIWIKRNMEVMWTRRESNKTPIRRSQRVKGHLCRDSKKTDKGVTSQPKRLRSTGPDGRREVRRSRSEEPAE